jgi:hypothetical protein
MLGARIRVLFLHTTWYEPFFFFSQLSLLLDLLRVESFCGVVCAFFERVAAFFRAWVTQICGSFD